MAVDFYEDFCSFLLDLNIMADESELSNASEFIKGTPRLFLSAANMVYRQGIVSLIQDVPFLISY